MRKLLRDVEDKVIVLIKNGYSARKIAEKLNISRQTVINVKKRQNIVQVVNAGGRPRKLTDGDARAVERLLRKNECRTPREAAAKLELQASTWTVRRSLNKIGMVAAVKQKKPALSERNVKARLHFCRERKDWTIEDWKRVIWSDETKINRYQSDGKAYFWHRPQEKLQRGQVKQTVKFGGGSLMIWGCFTWWHIGPLFRISGIMNKEIYLHILNSQLPDFVDECAYPAEEIIFQQDGDPKHTAKIVQEWLQNQSFKTFKWPAQSPDLNPIENLWAYVKQQLAKYRNPPSNMDELWSRVQTEWRNIPHSIIENLVESMPRRIKSVIKNKGLWTKY